MSIYATLWALKFPSSGQFYLDCDWVTVVAQGVPAHVGAEETDRYAAFLPPLPGSVAAGLRAVVFVSDGMVKGTSRSPQEYRDPLFVLSGVALFRKARASSSVVLNIRYSTVTSCATEGTPDFSKAKSM